MYLFHIPLPFCTFLSDSEALSAMGLDPIGGRATNLMPCREAQARQGEASSEEPQDIYQQVSDMVCGLMKIDAAGKGPNAEFARQLLAIMDRNLAKPATMTIPYGATLYTIYEELCEEDAIKALKDPEGCAMYLAKLLVQCIPSGGGPDHEMASRSGPHYRKVNGIVAHLVHSMDAAHMMLTTNRLYALGLRHFAMVHDSYGVHACDVDLLNRILREEFVRIYSEPVLQNFIERQRKAHPGLKLPDPPKTGDLDIRLVLESTYSFA